MHTNRHSLKLFGILGAVFFAAAPVSAQCIDQWLPGEGLPGLNGQVNATVVYDDGSGPALYVGGSFNVAGETVANNIARWDGTTWLPLGRGMNGPVNALAVYKGELIAAGAFANRIARWDGKSWLPLGSGMNNSVFALTEYNGELIAGGYFTTAGGTTVNHIARWDGTIWSPLGSGMGGEPGDHETQVIALTEYNGELIAGGAFTTAGGTPANRIASWDGKSWSPLGSGMPEYYGQVFTLTGYGGGLIAGGGFTIAGGTEANRIARWDGTNWSPLGSGMNNTVHALTVYNGELIAGGRFTTAGEHVSAFWARWGADIPLGDLDGDCSVGYADLDILLANWRPCADCNDCPADLDADCTVGVVDLLLLLENWG